MAEWSDLIIPLAVALTQRNAKGAAFVEGFTRADQLLDEQRRRNATDLRQQQMADAQIANLQADNARQDVLLQRGEEQAALQRLSQAVGALEPTIARESETATDATAAENAILARTPALESAFRLQPGQLSGFVPPMQPTISQRTIRRARAVHDEFTKKYGDQAAEAEGVLRMNDGEFAGKTFAEIRALAQAVPPAPAPTKKATPATPGTFEEYVGLPPEQQAVRLKQRKEFLQSDDRPRQSTGIDPRTPTFNRIAAEAERSPLVRAADRTVVLDDAVRAVEQNPADPASQLRLAYGYIQALDTYQSAVREGELGNLGILGTRLQQWATEMSRVASTGAFLPPEVAKNIAHDAKQLVQVIIQGAARKRAEFASRARVSGVGDMWDAYEAGAKPQAPSAPSGGPRIGERRDFGNGRIGEWDGKGWKLVTQ